MTGVCFLVLHVLRMMGRRLRRRSRGSATGFLPDF